MRPPVTTMTTSRDRLDDSAERRVAHDLLQSVVIIQSLCGTQRLSPDRVSLDEHLRLIEQECHTMAALCERVLGTEPRIERIDLRDVASRVVERARVVFAGTVDLDAEEAWIDGDRVEWERCLHNLAVNACRAAGDGGSVEVRVTATPSTISVMIGDSGPGYGRAVTGGASLGMVTVDSVVRRHGGQLQVGQSRLGGAALTVVVPRDGRAPDRSGEGRRDASPP